MEALRKDKAKALDPIDTECHLITCKNMPPELMETGKAREHFKAYGTVRRMRFKFRSLTLMVYYETLESAKEAVLNAGNYHGNKFDVVLGTGKKNRAHKGPSAEVLAELEAHSAYAHVHEDLKARKLTKLQEKMKAKKAAIPAPVLQKLVKVKLGKIIGKKTWTSEQLDLLKVLKQPAFNTEEKYKVLDARDKLIRLRNKKSVDILRAEHTVGTCPDMCPEKERLLRVVQHQVASYEQEPNSKQMLPELAVKQYSRSSADQESPLPHDLRPVSVLQMTMNYLMQEVMNDCDNSDVNLGDWYHYMWDRTRAIRKDITQQELCCQGSVNLVEQCARFHIHCSARLAGEDPSVFDQKINTENLTKCLQSLKYMYHDLSLKGEICPNEPEFRAYIILLNLNDGNFMWEMQQLHGRIQKSPEVRFAIEAYSCIDKNNYIRFFKLVQNTTYLNACILLRYFIQVRYRALQTIVIVYSPVKFPTLYPVEELTRLLAFENTEATENFLDAYNLYLNDERSHVVLDRKAFSMPEIPLSLERAVNFIESKRLASVGEIVCGEVLPPKTYLNHKPYSSFDTNGHFNIKRCFPDFDDNIVSKDVPDAGVDIKPNLKINDESSMQKPFWVPTLSTAAPPQPVTTTNIFATAAKSAEKANDGISFDVKPLAQSTNIFASTAKPVEKAKGGFSFELKSTEQNTTSIFATPQQTSNLFFKPALDAEQTPPTFSNFAKPAPVSSLPQSNFRFKLSPQKTTSEAFFPSSAPNQNQLDMKQKIEDELKKKLEAKAEMEKKLREKQEELERKRLQALEEQKRQQEAQRLEIERQQRQEMLEEQQRREEQLRKQKEEEELRRKIELERLERLRQEQLRKEEEERRRMEAKRAEEERRRKILEEKMRMEEIRRTVKDVIESLVTNVERIHRENRLNAIKQNVRLVKMKNFVARWIKYAHEQKCKRQYIQNSLWISSKTPNEEAKELYSSGQNSTLANAKRYRLGKPENLSLLNTKTLKKLNVAQIVYPILMDNFTAKNKLTRELFWKCLVSVPDQTELESEINDLNDDISEILDVKNARCVKSMRLLNTFTYSIEKKLGIEAAKRDFDGVIIITKNLNKHFIDRVSLLVKNFTETYTPPVYIIIEEPMNNVESFEKYLLDNNVVKYKIVCGSFYAPNLPDLVSNGLKFVAREANLPPNTLLELLRNFLVENLGVELWTTIRSMGDCSLPYKNCLTQPKIVVKLYNEAIDRIKILAFENNVKKNKIFPTEFANSKFTRDRCMPLDYKHFPANFDELSYKNILHDVFLSLKLPDYEAIWPPKCQKSLELVVFEYCEKIFENPIPAFYKIMAKVLDYINDDFDNIASFDWTKAIEIIASDKILLLDCDVENNGVRELFVIYNSDSLKQHKESFWFYLENENVRDVLDFKLEEACLPVDDDDLDETVVSRKRKLPQDLLDFDIDATFEALFKTNKNRKETNRRECKAGIENVKRMMCDLEESIQTSKKINEKIDSSLRSLFQ